MIKQIIIANLYAVSVNIKLLTLSQVRHHRIRTKLAKALLLSMQQDVGSPKDIKTSVHNNRNCYLHYVNSEKSHRKKINVIPTLSISSAEARLNETRTKGDCSEVSIENVWPGTNSTCRHGKIEPM